MQRLLSQEGLLWVERMEVSAQAVSKRLQALPIELFTQIFEQVMQTSITKPKHQAIPENWQLVCGRFTAIWIADGSKRGSAKKEVKSTQRTRKNTRWQNHDGGGSF